MRLGVVRKSDDPARAMWRALSTEEKAFALACGLYTLDDDGLPVIDGDVLARTMKAIENAMARDIHEAMGAEERP